MERLGEATRLRRGYSEILREQAGVAGGDDVLPRRVAELVFRAIVGGQEVLRRKVSLRCAPKSVRRWCRVESQNQL
jgi:hypothetical protein